MKPKKNLNKKASGPPPQDREWAELAKKNLQKLSNHAHAVKNPSDK